MHGALTFAEAFRGIVSNISMALLLGLIAIAVIAWMVKTMATPMRKLLGGGIVRVALAAAMVWTGIVESFSKHTNDPPRSVALPLLSITPEDISNGWRMVETRDGCAFSRAHDGTCAIHEPWLVRGGFGDVVRISANGWFFPWRDGFADELIVFSDGEIRHNLRTSFFPRPFDVPLAVVPAFNWHQLLGCASNVFWHVSTPSNSIVVAWENAPVNRDANILTNFQAEFFADGRFAYRYDDRMVDYSPVFPFDWDNDGLANSVDPDPLVAGPDAHGTNAVIFEDTYEDKPDVWRPKRSNRVRLTVSASGGSLGGVLTLATANLGKLSPVACGPMLFPPSMELAPYDVYCASFLCEGNEESDSTGDVSVSGTFVENGTGETFHSNDSMTVFRIELEPIVSAPANACVHRHKVGVGEVVKCRQWPAAPVLSYAAIGEGVFSNATDRLYVCPLQEEFKGLRMSCGNVEYKPLLEVIEPEEIECTECVPLPVSPLEGVGMRLELRVLPYDVSFVGIALQEVPSLNGTHTGYFAQSCYQHRWYHTVAWGAGEWKSVTDGNLWGYDHSRMFRWDQPWDRGTLAWEIPIGWNRAGTTRGACFKQKDMNANSCWDMQPYVITKTKHWQVLSLGTDGSWMLNGENCDE